MDVLPVPIFSASRAARQCPACGKIPTLWGCRGKFYTGEKHNQVAVMKNQRRRSPREAEKNSIHPAVDTSQIFPSGLAEQKISKKCVESRQKKSS